MPTKVAQMTKDELRELIEATIELKLIELLGDPGEGLVVRKAVRDRLLRQQQAVADGERGEPFVDVIRRLGLDEICQSYHPKQGGVENACDQERVHCHG